MKFWQKIEKRLFPAALVLLSAVVALGSYSLAKYTSNDSTRLAVTPKSFYFESDLLAPAEENLSYTVNGDTIAFELYNYADAVRISEQDVPYTVSITKGGSPVNLSTAENATGTLDKNTPERVRFSVSGLAAGSYTVTVSTTDESIFEKTMTATFTLVQSSELTVTYTDAANEGTLTLTTSDAFAKTVTVTWSDTNLLLDNRNLRPEITIVNATTATITTTGSNAYTLHFYKTVSGNNVLADFTVTH